MKSENVFFIYICLFVFFFFCLFVQVYWAGPMSAAVVAALLYNFVLTSTDVTLNKKSRALLCESLSSENEFHEHVEDVKWSKEPGV